MQMMTILMMQIWMRAVVVVVVVVAVVLVIDVVPMSRALRRLRRFKRHVLAMRKACDTVTRLVKHVRIYNVVSVAFLWDAHDAPFFHPAEAYHSSSRL